MPDDARSAVNETANTLRHVKSGFDVSRVMTIVKGILNEISTSRRRAPFVATLSSESASKLDYAESLLIRAAQHQVPEALRAVGESRPIPAGMRKVVVALLAIQNLRSSAAS